MRRLRVTTPGGKHVMHYTLRKHARAQCGKCGTFLQAVATGRPSVIHKLSKSERRPSRPYGGVLCSRCMRLTIKAKARAQ
jgi:large subunit ribosomal protein L34e